MAARNLSRCEVAFPPVRPTSAPGFDAIAVALNLYVEVTLELADEFALTSEGCGAGQFDGDEHLGAVVATSILGHTNYSLHVKSEIPVSRGLGSSAALALAAAGGRGRD